MFKGEGDKANGLMFSANDTIVSTERGFFTDTYPGARDFSGLGLRPKMCWPSAHTENSRRARGKPLVPRVTDTMTYVTRFLGPTLVIRPWFELTASSPLAGHQHVFK